MAFPHLLSKRRDLTRAQILTLHVRAGYGRILALITLFLFLRGYQRVTSRMRNTCRSQPKKENTIDREGRRHLIVNRRQLKKYPNYYHQREECYENQQRRNGDDQNIQNPVLKNTSKIVKTLKRLIKRNIGMAKKF